MRAGKCRLEPLMEKDKINRNTVMAYMVGRMNPGKTTFTLVVTGIEDPFNVLERTHDIEILELRLDQVGCLRVHKCCRP